MKNKSLSFSQATGALARLLRRFHTLLFFLLVSGGLFAAIIILLGTINLSSSVAPTADQSISPTFDEATIDRLNQTEASSPQAGARQSPFTE